jgi:hypothetical protein
MAEEKSLVRSGDNVGQRAAPFARINRRIRVQKFTHMISEFDEFDIAVRGDDLDSLEGAASGQFQNWSAPFEADSLSSLD